MASAALIIGANIPDADVISYAWGPLTALEHRRGWTHGILALALWPLVLTWGISAWHRWFGGRDTPAPDRRRLMAVSALAVASHPLLDLMNTYGVRLLMPFSDRWFYGDVLFIVDIWLWTILGLGVVLSAVLGKHLSRWSLVPARASLVAALGYILVVAAAGRATLESATLDYRRVYGDGRVVLASPLPVKPMARNIIAYDGTNYRLGASPGLGGDIRWESTDFYGLNLDRAADPVVRAAASESGRQFLGWARFPTAQLSRDSSGTVVHLVDLRYATGPERFGSVSIAIPQTSNVETNGD